MKEVKKDIMKKLRRARVYQELIKSQKEFSIGKGKILRSLKDLR